VAGARLWAKPTPLKGAVFAFPCAAHRCLPGGTGLRAKSEEVWERNSPQAENRCRAVARDTSRVAIARSAERPRGFLSKPRRCSSARPELAGKGAGWGLGWRSDALARRVTLRLGPSLLARWWEIRCPKPRARAGLAWPLRVYAGPGAALLWHEPAARETPGACPCAKGEGVPMSPPSLGAVSAAGIGAITGTGLFLRLNSSRGQGYSSVRPAVVARAVACLVPAQPAAPSAGPCPGPGTLGSAVPSRLYFLYESKSLGRPGSGAGALASTLFIFGGCCLAVREHNSSEHNSVSLHFSVL